MRRSLRKRGEPPDTGTPETAVAALSTVHSTDLQDVGTENVLNNQLSNAVPLRNFEILVPLVRQKDLDLPTEAAVDNTSSDMDAVLDGETRSWGYAGVSTHGRRDGDASADEKLPQGGMATFSSA